MLRDTAQRIFDTDPDFEWRGHNVTRIENLSDIVFALALGMLVSSSNPPVTSKELVQFLWNIIPVSVAFFVMLSIWNAHFTFFRRYNLADSRVVLLNAILLLFVLFIAYPLRFIFDSLYAYVLFLSGHPARAVAMDLDGESAARMMSLYGIGYGFIYVIFHRLYAHALRQREMLDLSDREVALTRDVLLRFLMQTVLSILVAFTAYYSSIGAMAGFIWCLAWPIGAVINYRARKKLARIPG